MSGAAVIQNRLNRGVGAIAVCRDCIAVMWDWNSTERDGVGVSQDPMSVK